MILTNLKIIGIIFLLEVSILYNDRLYLTPQEILEKEFKIDARGYRPQEVDKFLDMVIRDYTEYSNIVKKLEKDIKDLTDDNIKLKGEIRRLQEVASTNSDTPSRSINNVDLLKRISQLEKVVYGNNE
jgi:DivIVA domain-containing protein